MNAMTEPLNPPPVRRRGQILTISLAVISTFGLGFGLVFFYFLYPLGRSGPAQPIPFSHRLHVQIKEIDCRYCHSTVERSAQAGLPPVEKCLHCHEHIITQHPVIQNLRRHRDENIPILWRKVFYLPDHAHFSHWQHVRAGVDCAQCHGNVEAMDRVSEANALTMGYCVNCHVGNQIAGRVAPVDCYTCHQ